MKLNNTEKNTFSTRLIIESTLELLKDKEITDISISEISKRSGISRMTIYRNFNTKEEIVKKYILNLLKNWIHYHTIASTRTETDTMFVRLFEILQDNKEIFLLLKKRSLLYLLREILKDVLGPSKEKENFVAYLSAFYFSGIFGWIEEWINRGMVDSADMIETFLRNREIK